MPKIPSETEILLVGNGRISRALARFLKPLGARVTIASRCPTRAQIPTGTYAGTLPRYDAVVNTAPAMVLDAAALAQLRSDCLVLDLASAPGGVDRAAAARLGRRMRWELGLPGREFPVTAGRIITQTVLDALAEQLEGALMT